jgi:hypothetical protein
MASSTRRGIRLFQLTLLAAGAASFALATSAPAFAACTVTFCQSCPADPTCAGCSTGFFLNGGNNTCNDINECATNNGGCAVQAQCTNTLGARFCICNSGYSGDGLNCIDVNECATNGGGCAVHAQCSNQVGAPRICTCDSGYGGDGITCTDINECATNGGGCDPHAQCANLPGTRTCTCNGGFSGDGLTCADINECATNGGGCDPLTTCTNVPGSRTCSACPSGYSGTGDTTCADINECGSNPCLNGGTCTNATGTFTCDCPAGVTGQLCDTNGYVPPDKDTAACENAVAYNVASYVKCVTRCRVKKASKERVGKDFDEQGCQAGEKSACRSKYDKRMAKLIADGCPDCLDATAQTRLANDALAGVIDTKGRAFCKGSVPLAP